MNDIFLLILSLSLSGSLLTLIIFSMRPIIKHRLSKSWQYYIYLIVILRLLIPLTPETSLVNGLFHVIGQEQSNTGGERQGISGDLLPETDSGRQVQQSKASDDARPAIVTDRNQSGRSPYIEKLFGFLGAAWAVVALVLLVRKISVYHSFINFMKAGCRRITDPAALGSYQLICREQKIYRPPALYVNEIAAAPMLVGILKPYIVIPDGQLTGDELSHTLMHELIHYKRMDICYKWLMQIVSCIHWYNPVIYLLSREIDRNCELSCDESVIRRLGETEKYNYGDTLLSTIKPDKGYSSAIISVTLNESTKLIKERLDAIMKYRKKSVKTLCLSLILTAVLSLGAVYTGAYAANDPVPEYPDYYWSSTHDVPYTAEFAHVPADSKLQFGTFSLSSEINYSIMVTWSGGAGTLGVNLIGKDGHYSEHIISNGSPVNLNIPRDGFYFFESPRNRDTGDMAEFTFQLQADQSSELSVGSGERVSEVVRTSAPVMINDCSIKYEDTKYKWPYIEQTIKNNSAKDITGYEIVMLAYDKDGKPLELYWDARNVDENGGHGNIGFAHNGVEYGYVVGIYPYSEKSYDWKLEMTGLELSPGGSESYGGWNLFDGWWNQSDGKHKVHTLIACVKRVSFGDGSTWENPGYELWRDTYMAKVIGGAVLEGYYPY